jgi:rhodanese-related sulfurtransferase
VSQRSRIDLLLSAARARLHRLTPLEALRAVERGAVVVDIRPAAQRAEHGDLPGALVVERNVLEWRFDPTSEAALRIADDDLQVIVLCQEGYTSSLAAAALQDVGVHAATDVIGGYAAWVAAGVAPPAATPGQRFVTRRRAG